MEASSHYERIEAYFEQRMPEAERRALEAELRRNPALREAYEAYQAALIALGLLAAGEAPALAEGKRRPLRAYLPWAAAVVFLLGLSSLFWYAGNYYSDAHLAGARYQLPLVDQLERSGAAAWSPDPAWLAFGRGEYRYAVELFTAPGKKNGPLDWYYLAHAHYQLGNYEEAMAAFGRAAAAGDAALRRKAEWFGALSALQAGEEEQALQILQSIQAQEGHPQREEAMALLKKLRSFWRRLVLASAKL